MKYDYLLCIFGTDIMFMSIRLWYKIEDLVSKE